MADWLINIGLLVFAVASHLLVWVTGAGAVGHLVLAAVWGAGAAGLGFRMKHVAATAVRRRPASVVRERAA